MTIEGDAIHDVTEVTVDSTKNLIVVHPDVLISSTSVASSLRCPRRAVLNDLFKVGSSHLLK